MWHEWTTNRIKKIKNTLRQARRERKDWKTEAEMIGWCGSRQQKIRERKSRKRAINRDEWKTSEKVRGPPCAVGPMMIMMSTWHIPCLRIKRICNEGSMTICHYRSSKAGIYSSGYKFCHKMPKKISFVPTSSIHVATFMSILVPRSNPHAIHCVPVGF